jgi:DNA-directed RNA polymerase specialized sigma24 family protein
MTRRSDLGMSLQEIAEETGMSVSAVSVTLTRGLRKLRREGLIQTARELAQELDRNRREIVE